MDGLPVSCRFCSAIRLCRKCFHLQIQKLLIGNLLLSEQDLQYYAFDSGTATVILDDDHIDHQVSIKETKNTNKYKISSRGLNMYINLVAFGHFIQPGWLQDS